MGKVHVPPVDGHVAPVEPPDGGQLVSGGHGTQVDQQVVLRDHQVQSPHNVPAVRCTGHAHTQQLAQYGQKRPEDLTALETEEKQRNKAAIEGRWRSQTEVKRLSFSVGGMKNICTENIRGTANARCLEVKPDSEG